MRLLVRSVFGVATLQDGGRCGYRKFGVPVGGAFDTESFTLANALLGNRFDAPAIEFALGTLELEALSEGAVAIVGAAEQALVNGVARRMNSVLMLASGDSLTIVPPKRGLRTYIAVCGGVASEAVLGSVSGASIERGAALSSREDREVFARGLGTGPLSLVERPLRVLPTAADTSWIGAAYLVGRSIDRVGLRLEGARPMMDPRSFRSEPSVSGAVQLTEDRGVIVHGPDGPTIGGYVKIGCVVRADLDRLGQLAPGDGVSFQCVTLEQANSAWREHGQMRSRKLGEMETSDGRG